MSLEISLTDRVAIVTGASAGIGRGIALALAQAGASVVVADVDETPPTGEVVPTVEAIETAGGEAHYVETDVADCDAVEALVAETVASYGGLDVLVNNAGVSHDGTVEETTPETWDRVLGVNLTGVYHGVHHAMPVLKRSPAARVINVASQLALVGRPRKPAYLASKGGVVSLTRQLAVDYADVPVLVNAICPGVVRTELTREALSDPDSSAFLESETLLPYLGDPDDVGAMAAFLASDLGRYITGQCLVVDGGYTAH
ncbi:SDR family NAD(P)-dependent oxidoreductase [Salinigranum halophilum]|uniref:SDR family NAD(P)-dependent oxidoreductase n=1 Tax=Salinigranum halophilum TaxID=2565931 RepID=UPI0010A765A7|nr:glucose 1-dehydrogenase [Salinigranum halophilum]